jgi:hypothetical protein
MEAAPDARTPCSTCTAPFAEGTLVCHACGTAREAMSGLEAQRAALEELHRALAAAMHEAKAKEAKPEEVRDRFLQNALVPTHPELLVDEAIRCQQFFLQDLAANTAGPQARYRACLLKLEMVAIDKPAWKRKVKVLRANLEGQSRREWRSNVAFAVGFVVFVGVVVMVIVYVVHALALLWGGAPAPAISRTPAPAAASPR